MRQNNILGELRSAENEFQSGHLCSSLAKYCLKLSRNLLHPDSQAISGEVLGKPEKKNNLLYG